MANCSFTTESSSIGTLCTIWVTHEIFRHVSGIWNLHPCKLYIIMTFLYSILCVVLFLLAINPIVSVGHPFLRAWDCTYGATSHNCQSQLTCIYALVWRLRSCTCTRKALITTVAAVHVSRLSEAVPQRRCCIYIYVPSMYTFWCMHKYFCGSMYI